MARKKNSGNNNDLGDDIEPVWVSPDAAEDDWGDDFSSPGAKGFDRQEVEIDDDFDGPVAKSAPETPSLSAQGRKSVANDGFDDDFDTAFDSGGDLDDDTDDLDMSDMGDNEGDEPTKRGAGKSSLPTAKLVPYAAMGAFGLLIVYFGFNMLFGGAKTGNVASSSPPPPPPATQMASQNSGQNTGIAAGNPVNLQASNAPPGNLSPISGGMPSIGAAPNKTSAITNPSTVGSPIGAVPAPGAGPTAMPIGLDTTPSTNINDLASMAPQSTTTDNGATQQANLLPMPTGMEANNVPVVMNGGVPTLPISGDPNATAKRGAPSGTIGEEQLKQFGDRMMADFRNDMDRFKGDITQSVKSTLEDDMTMMRAQLEGISRRVDSIEDNRGNAQPLQQIVKPVPEAREAMTPAPDIAQEMAPQMADEPAQPVVAAQATSTKTATADDQSNQTSVKGNVDTKAPKDTDSVMSDRDNSALKPIEPIKIAKGEKSDKKSNKPMAVKKSAHKGKKNPEPAQKPEPFMAQGLPAAGGSNRNLAASPFQKMARAEPSGLYQLRGVAAGTAWLSAPNSGSIMTVSRGDFLPGLGRVTEIRRGFSGWEVVAEKGMLRQ